MLMHKIIADTFYFFAIFHWKMVALNARDTTFKRKKVGEGRLHCKMIIICFRVKIMRKFCHFDRHVEIATAIDVERTMCRSCTHTKVVRNERKLYVATARKNKRQCERENIERKWTREDLREKWEGRERWRERKRKKESNEGRNAERTW